MKQRTQKIMIGLAAFASICMLINLTYALWKYRFQQADESIVSTSCFDFSLTNDGILSIKTVPLDDEEGLLTNPHTITIKNKCDVSAEVEVYLDILKTSKGPLNKFKFNVTGDIIVDTKTVNDLATIDTTHEDTVVTKGLASIYFNSKEEKTFEMRAWMDESVGNGVGEDYVLDTKITLEAEATPVQYNPVQATIIADNGGTLSIRGKLNSDLQSISPHIKYEDTINDRVTRAVDIIPQEPIAYSATYKFNERTRLYELQNPITEVLNDSFIGKYTCNGTTSCIRLYKVNEIKMHEGPDILFTTEEEVFDTEVDTQLVLGKGYSYDEEMWEYTLKNTIKDAKLSKDYIGYYFLDSYEEVGWTLYEIVDVTPSEEEGMIQVSTKATYIEDYNYDQITKYELHIGRGAGAATEDTGLYLGKDDFGDTYYFRGGNEKNNIYFAGYYWNIVRINGDGTLRLIYRGTTPTATGTDAQIGTSRYNAYSSHSLYVGYMMEAPDYSGDRDLLLPNQTDSEIKKYLEKWYEENLLDDQEYIADSLFCNDRGIYSGLPDITENKFYNAYNRLDFSAGVNPTFMCSDKNDRFTVKNQYGNQKNKYPIGLITADEASFAGLYGTTAATYNYLRTNAKYWTMTPQSFEYAANVIQINTTGGMSIKQDESANLVTASCGVRPVINLKGNIKLSGTGTIEDPYIVEGLQ